MKLTWDSLVAPVITDETFGLAAHHAIASWDKGTPSSSAIGFSPLTFFRTSSTSDRLARFCKEKNHIESHMQKYNSEENKPYYKYIAEFY